MSRRSRRVARDATSATLLVALLAGCQGNESSADSTEVAESIAEVEYYYACGNEVLQLPDGRRFYPFVDQDQVDEDAYLSLSEPSPQSASERLATATLIAVPMPEPGEDIGTLTIFKDGIARFVSETGTEAWLTDEEQTYNWEC